MRQSDSQFFSIRGLRMHLRSWSSPSARTADPIRLILHGWSDTSATWQRVVNFLPTDWHIVAPDWRGFGLSDRGGDTYIFADYLADLDALLHELGCFETDGPKVDLIGHSMGGQIAALYAGLRPEVIRRLVILDALFLPPSEPEKAPQRMRDWLNDLQSPAQEKCYESLEDLAERTRKYHTGLDEKSALQVAEAWSENLPDGRLRLLADPRHRQRGPILYRDEEALAIFAEVTAPTLILDAAKSYLASMCPAEVRQKRLDALNLSAQRVIDDCGHMMHFDAPQATGEAIVDFLSE